MAHTLSMLRDPTPLCAPLWDIAKDSWCCFQANIKDMFPGYSAAAFGCGKVEAQGLFGADKTLGPSGRPGSLVCV